MQVILQLVDSLEQLPIVGKVVWNTPVGAQGALTAGIGVQFAGDTAPEVRKKISTYVAGMLNSERRTDTM